MRLRVLVLALWGCSAGVFAFPVAADAAASFGPQSDILGIVLGTPGRDVKLSVAKNFRGSFIADIHAKFGAGQIKRDVVVGYLADVTAIPNQQANAAAERKMAGQRMGNLPLDRVVAQEGDLTRDQLSFAADPNDGPHSVYAIERRTDFPKSARPVMTTVEASLIAKYGPPARTVREWPGVVHYYWFTNASLAKQQQFLSQCVWEADHYNKSISPGETVRNNDPDRDVTSYPYLMSYLGTRLYFFGKDIRKCGTILSVTVSPPQQVGQERYASSIEEVMFDYNAAFAYVNAYALKFRADVNAASQSKLQQDSKIKPTL